MFPRTDAIKIARRHQFHQLGPCWGGIINVKAVSLDYTGFIRLHSYYLLEFINEPQKEEVVIEGYE